jgi:hypothetical protein
VTRAVKTRLRAMHCTLDPVALLAEMRDAQTELGERIDHRAGKMPTRLPVPSSAADAAVFAKTLGKAVEAGERRGTHRRPKRNYIRRVRTPSMLDPHVATIEGWLAAEPELTALAIVGRLSEGCPEQFCKKQHSIVQRLLRALRRKTAETLMAEMSPSASTSRALVPGAVDGAACEGTPPRPQPLPWSKRQGAQPPPYPLRLGNIPR